MKLCTTVIFWKYFILINVLNILHVSQPCVPMSARMEETALFPIHASAQTAGQETHACKVSLLNGSPATIAMCAT